MISINVADGTSLDHDEFASFQQHAFADLDGIVRAETIQTPQYYRWKYFTPWGPAKVSSATINGMLAAGVAALPWALTDGVNDQIAWQLCDIATHPDYRRRGFFRRCLSTLLSTLPADSVVFCFPNRQSLPALVSMGFSQTGALRIWASISPLLGMGRGKGREEPWNPNGLRPINPPTPGIFQTRVDNHYLEWRFVRRPEHEYRRIRTWGHGGDSIVRSLIICGQKISIVMLVISDDAAAERALLHSTVSLESARGARAILYLDSCWRGSLNPLFFPLASWMSPRAFPIVSTGLKGASLHLRTCDWDVL